MNGRFLVNRRDARIMGVADAATNSFDWDMERLRFATLHCNSM